MKKLFYLAIAGLTFELDASEVKNPLQEISEEAGLPMIEVATIQLDDIKSEPSTQAQETEIVGPQCHIVSKTYNYNSDVRDYIPTYTYSVSISNLISKSSKK